MDHLFDIASRFFESWPVWLSALTGIIAAASSVAALTPTPRDDKIVGKLYKIVDLLALNVGYAKRPPSRAEAVLRARPRADASAGEGPPANRAQG